eukprot:COSAG06_NODE_1036_length_10998_cov_27.475181_7_plen_91_part_00
MRVCACLAIVRATTTIAVLHVGKLTSVGISPELLYSLLQEEFIPYNTQSQQSQSASGSGSDTVAGVRTAAENDQAIKALTRLSLRMSGVS